MFSARARTVKDNSLPEEKLLRLIRGKKSKLSSASDGSPAHAAPPAASLSFKRFFSGRGAGFPAGLRVDSGKILFVLFISSAVYFAAVLVQPWLGRAKRSFLPKDDFSESAEIQIKGMKPVDFYLEAVRAKNLFRQTAAPPAARPVVKMAGEDLKNFILVGVIAGDDPQAVIEDKKNSRTYYVRNGQYVGDFQVQDILEGKIVLSQGDQSFELYL